jgi:predicted transposase YbfD/YdcC
LLSDVAWGKAAAMTPFAIAFADVPDPRLKSLVGHSLMNVLTIVTLATLCGAEGWDDMSLWATVNVGYLATLLDLSQGLPSADTLRRVMARLLPGPLRKAYAAWAKALVEHTEGKLIALDGKANKGSRRRFEGVPAVHVVRAWVTEHRLVLGQLATDAKSNEITAIPELLDLLSIKGATITIDAMGTQRKIATKILDGEANYMMSVRENQPTMHEEVQGKLAALPEPKRPSTAFASTEEKSRDRHEIRRVWTYNDLDKLPFCQAWPGAKTIVRYESERTTCEGTTVGQRYFITSREVTAKEVLPMIRSHWGIENTCHWTLDVVFGEDDCRIWEGHAPENLSLIRNLLMVALKNETTRKLSMRQKRKLCMWDHNYLLLVLRGLF